MEELLTLACAVEGGGPHDNDDDPAEDEDDVVDEASAHVEDELRQRGEGAGAHVLEHVLEDRNDLPHHDDDHADGDDPHGDRVDHRAFNLGAQLHRLFNVRRQPHHDGVEDTGNLARGDEVDEQFVEDLGVAAQGVGERRAALDASLDVREDLAEVLVVRLVGEDIQRLDQRQASVDHRGELPRENNDIAESDA